MKIGGDPCEDNQSLAWFVDGGSTGPAATATQPNSTHKLRKKCFVSGQTQDQIKCVCLSFRWGTAYALTGQRRQHHGKKQEKTISQEPAPADP